MTRFLTEALRSLQTPLLLTVGLAIVVLTVGGHSASLDRTLLFALITMMVVVGLYVFVGLSGVLSFGQIGFMAIGAYVCGMLTIPEVAKPVIIPNAPSLFLDNTVSTPVGVLIGSAAAALLAWLVSFPLMRLSGLAASIATLAVLLIVYTFFQNWQPGTSGGGNLTRIPVDLTVVVQLGWTVAAIVAVGLYGRSRWGMRLRATREDDVAARSLGINVHRERRIAFVMSAAIIGAAGGLFGHAVGSFSATSFYLPLTFLTMAMLVLGGMLSLTGAVLGSAVLSVVSYVFEQWQNGNPVLGLTLDLPPGTRDIVVAGLLLVALLTRSGGLVGSRELRLPRRRRPGPEAGLTASTVLERERLSDDA